jgi:hypothetical protein
MLTPKASNSKEEPVMDYRSPTIHSSKLTMAGSSLYAQAPSSQEFMTINRATYGYDQTSDSNPDCGGAVGAPLLTKVYL